MTKATTEIQLADKPGLPDVRRPAGTLGVDPCALVEKAVDSKAAVEVIRELRMMWLDDKRMQAQAAFQDAMQAVQKALPVIVKTARNPSTNSAFVKMEDLQGVVSPLALEHGLTLSFGTDKSELPEHYGVTCDVEGHGHTKSFRCDVPCDMYGPKGQPNKTRTHGFGSAISYGQRYLLKLIFNIRLVGDDDDGNLGRRTKPQGPSIKQPASELKELAGELWRLLKDVRGKESNWQAANDWLWREEILDGAANEAAPNLSAERFHAVIEAVKERLA